MLKIWTLLLQDNSTDVLSYYTTSCTIRRIITYERRNIFCAGKKLFSDHAIWEFWMRQLRNKCNAVCSFDKIVLELLPSRHMTSCACWVTIKINWYYLCLYFQFLAHQIRISACFTYTYKSYLTNVISLRTG